MHSEREYSGRGPRCPLFWLQQAEPATQREKKDCEKSKEGAVIALRRWGFKTMTAKKFVDLFQYRMLSLSTLYIYGMPTVQCEMCSLMYRVNENYGCRIFGV